MWEIAALTFEVKAVRFLVSTGGIRFEEWSQGAGSAAGGWNGNGAERAAALFRN
jgi:hypothetical protein